MKKGTEKYLLLLVLMIALLGGCVATTVKQATMRETIDVPTGIDAKPLLFKKGIVKLPRGEKIVSNQVGLLCIPSAPLTWRGGRVTLSGDELPEVFVEDLEKANYPLVGNPAALFEDPGAWKVELLVAGLVKEMEANICYPMAGFRKLITSKGEAFTKAEWQIAPPIRVTDVNRYDQNTISLRKESVGQEQHRVNEAERLKFFLFLYCHTYESKDIDKFATFFAHDALENNKPFHELLPKYRRNMGMIESLDYRIELVSYSLQAGTGNITLQGKFYIRFLLHGGTWKEKSGNISMELTKRGISYLVKRLNYGD